MPSALESSETPKEAVEQYKSNLLQSTPADFMRPTTRTRGTSNAKTNGVGVQVEDTRICVVMVGLPARGKSLIAQKGRIHNLMLHGSYVCQAA